jgi:hypothetical protein
MRRFRLFPFSFVPYRRGLTGAKLQIARLLCIFMVRTRPGNPPQTRQVVAGFGPSALRCPAMDLSCLLATHL